MSKIEKLLLITLVLMLPLGATAQEFVRKIEQRTFVPKGQWIVGSTFSFSEYTDNNYNFLIVEGINTDGYTFKVSPMLAYALKDNIAVGGRFFYKRTLSRINSLDINLDEDTSFNLGDIYSLSHSYGATALLRNYINIGNSRRFAIYNEVQLSVEQGQSKVITGTGDKLSGTYQTRTEVGLGLSPGLVAFINNYMAVEVGIGVLGLSVNRLRQVTDQVQVAESSMTTANFKINLFSINFGIAFYL
ncbi:MAG: hypothetical protein ACRC3Z_08045 [Phocaeicola sp.]